MEKDETKEKVLNEYFKWLNRMEKKLLINMIDIERYIRRFENTKHRHLSKKLNEIWQQ